MPPIPDVIIIRAGIVIALIGTIATFHLDQPVVGTILAFITVGITYWGEHTITFIHHSSPGHRTTDSDTD